MTNSSGRIATVFRILDDLYEEQSKCSVVFTTAFPFVGRLVKLAKKDPWFERIAYPLGLFAAEKTATCDLELEAIAAGRMALMEPTDRNRAIARERAELVWKRFSHKNAVYQAVAGIGQSELYGVNGGVLYFIKPDKKFVKEFDKQVIEEALRLCHELAG